jgi:thiol-disulfide isomerase/thioredoxin
MARSRSLFTLIALASLLCVSQAAFAETVLLDFTSANCPPCRAMEPVLQQMAGEGHIIRSVDVARHASLARQLRVDSTPTFIAVVDGREWARLEGKTDQATLVGMMRKATELAAAEPPTEREPNAAPVSNVGLQQPAGAGVPAMPATFAGGEGPMEGRVVPIRDPFAIQAPRQPAAAPTQNATYAAGPQAAAPQPGAQQLSSPAAVEHLIAATVRLSMADSGGKSTGTGVIVDARNGMALVLTCGHLFRESQGKGAVEISMFQAGASGAEVVGTATGEVMHFDLNRDLALVRFAVNGPVNVAPVAPLGTPLEPNAPATCVGCSNGDNPTPWATRLTSINRYQGFPNVEAARAPVEGRSGGGLFNSAGQLIGICFAADPQADEGLYASLPSIHAKLDELQLSMVYQQPAGAGVIDARPAALAATSPAAAMPTTPGAAPADQFAVRGQNPVPESASALASAWPTPAAGAASTAPPASGLTAAEQATLQEIARRGADSEVICIIRPQSPDGRSEVIKISGASPAFVQALSSAAGAPAASAAAGTAVAAGPAGVMR